MHKKLKTSLIGQQVDKYRKPTPYSKNTMAPIALSPPSNPEMSNEEAVIPWNNKIKTRTILPLKQVEKEENERERIQEQIIASVPLKKPVSALRQINSGGRVNNNQKNNNIPKTAKTTLQSALNQPKSNKPLKISSKPMEEEAAEPKEEELSERFEQQMTFAQNRQTVRATPSVSGRRRSELLVPSAERTGSLRRPLITNPSSRRHPRFEPVAVLLDSATRGDLPELRRLLTRTRIDVNSCNSAGLTALHSAIANSHLKVAEFLLTQDAKVNVCDDKGWSPLHMAIANDDVECVRLLLDYNADVEAITDDQQTPLELSQDPVTAILEKMLQQKYHGKECLAMYDFEPQVELGTSVVGDELPFVEGEVLHIVNRKSGDWWLAENVFGHRGFVPKTHLQ